MDLLFLFFFLILKQAKFHSFHPVATILSYLTKAPLVSITYCHNINWVSFHLCYVDIFEPMCLIKCILTWVYVVLKILLQVPPGTPVVNALSKQRAMLENILRACIGLAPENNMILEYK